MVKVPVEVDAADFGAFFTKFLEFRAHLDATPEAWRAVAASAEATRGAYDEVLASASKHADAVDNAAASAGRLRNTADATARLWRDMSQSTGTVLKNIRSMTDSLLKWSGITGILGGVFTGGALTEFSAFAQRAGSARTQAIGAGSTTGGMRAADLAYSRFFPGGSGSGASFVNHIADLQRSSEGRALLAQYLPGMTQSQLENADPADLEGPILSRGHQLASGLSVAQLDYNPTLTKMFDAGTRRSLHGNAFSDAEYGQAQQFYTANKDSLGYNSGKQWQDFLQVLDTSKQKVESVFVNQLARLSGPLDKLVNEFSDAAVQAVKSPGFEQVMQDLNKDLEQFAGYMKSDAFKQGVSSFFADLGKIGPMLATLAEDVVSFAKWLGFDMIPQGTGGAGEGGSGEGNDRPTSHSQSGSGTSDAAAGDEGSSGSSKPGEKLSKPVKGRVSAAEAARIALAAGATPREAALLGAISQPESGGNPYAHNTNARTGDNSYGLWQINMIGRNGPERMKAFHLKSYNDLFDPLTNAKAAISLLRNRTGPNNWTTYSHGLYRRYVGGAEQGVREGPESTVDMSGAPAKQKDAGSSKVPHDSEGNPVYFPGGTPLFPAKTQKVSVSVSHAPGANPIQSAAASASNSGALQ